MRGKQFLNTLKGYTIGLDKTRRLWQCHIFALEILSIFIEHQFTQLIDAVQYATAKYILHIGC